jgi:hypothetical protein
MPTSAVRTFGACSTSGSLIFCSVCARSRPARLRQEEVESFLSNFRDAASWQDALQFLAAQPPSGGSPADLEAYVEELMAEAPLQFLVTKAIIGPESAGAIFAADAWT